MPGFWHLYSYEWRGGAPPQDFNENGQIDDTEWLNRNNQRATTGNPHLDYKRSTNLEVGTDWNFYQDYVISFTTYQQSVAGQVPRLPTDEFKARRKSPCPGLEG